jgi:hypothetical protein
MIFDKFNYQKVVHILILYTKIYILELIQCFEYTQALYLEIEKKGIIIPIHKPGKNKYSTKGYRPITLLNTITKIMEKIINPRLIWFLEKNEILFKEQSSFRHARSTIDNLITIKTEIENTFEH